MSKIEIHRKFCETARPGDVANLVIERDEALAEVARLKAEVVSAEGDASKTKKLVWEYGREIIGLRERCAKLEAALEKIVAIEDNGWDEVDQARTIAREALAPTPAPPPFPAFITPKVGIVSPLPPGAILVLRADTRKPSAENRYGAFLLETAKDQTLAELHGQAVGAFSVCDTLDQFRRVRDNLKLAEEIYHSREAAR